MTDHRDRPDVPELDDAERAALAAWQAPEPPPDFADRVTSAWSAEREASAPPLPPPTPAARSRRLAFLAVGGALAATLVAVLAGTLVLAPKREVAAGAPFLHALDAPPMPGSAAEPSPAYAPRPVQSPMAVPLMPDAQSASGALQPRRMADGRAHGNGPAARPDPASSAERYQDWGVNDFVETARDPLSTFSIDVDTASYAIARRKILAGEPVPPASIRVEEFLNYFRYDDPPPRDGRPFAAYLEAAPSPFTADTELLRIAIHAREVPPAARKRAHLVFLVDVSGSMSSPDKLPLAQRSLRILTANLQPGDTVALVTYASSTRVVLEPTGMDQRARIDAAIDELSAGGSTAMGSGLELAYRLAARQLGPDAVSRIIVLSDGDANVGPTSHEEILRTVHGYAQEGVTLSTIGFGMGNYRDDLMEQLADRANGNSYYIDSLSEARRVFQEQLGGTLEVVAQDVKIQVDFDPRVVSAYRLVGYENRDIADEDFRNDHVDAGEIGAGHAVTAMYELRRVPGAEGPLATVRLRAKAPGGSVATEWETPLPASARRPSMEAASGDLRLAAAVMGLAEILRASPHARTWSLATVASLARSATRAGDRDRQELVELIGAVAARPRD